MSGPDFRIEQEPHVDRFKDNTGRGRDQYSMEELEGFRPTTVGSENESGGWLRTTAPEGAPLTSLHELPISGSRGAEGALVADSTRKDKGTMAGLMATGSDGGGE